MNDVQKHEMIQAMHVYGGGFVQALATCFAHADQNNFQRLLNAFPEYVEQYLAMAGRDSVEKSHE